MVTVLCQTVDTLVLGQLKAFQGDLKKRTDKHIQSLMASIKNDGLIMPFAVWKTPDGDNMLLDGHGRLAALTEIALLDESVATQQFPVIYIHADSVEQAKKNLLQITSTYGNITQKGAMSFCASIPEYHAPAINRFIHKKPSTRKHTENQMEQIIKIAVPTDKAPGVIELLKEVAYIRIVK